MWWVLGAVLAVAVGGAVWARRELVVVTVEGDSMSPTYGDGDRVLVRRVRGVPRLPGRPAGESAGRVRPDPTGRPRSGGCLVGPVVVLAPPADPDAFVGRRRGRVRAAGRLWFVKRLVAGPGDPVPGGLGPALTAAAGTPVPAGRMVILGDNPGRSHDSRQEGFVAVDRIRGVVLRKL
ncbi:hypothetical protein Lfu02_58740 [Longispora fulva]|nr:hypothetical protein Lfu02_58740 [Longispora fulva]